MDLFRSCPHQTWSLLFFLCQNVKSWPQSVVSALPAGYTKCETTCWRMHEFRAWHEKQGKVAADFPASWDRIQERVNRQTNRTKNAETRDSKLSKPKQEIRNGQRSSSKWDDKDIIELPPVGMEFGEETLAPSGVCPKNTWISGLLDRLPKNICFYCVDFEGKPQSPNENQYICQEQSWRDGASSSIYCNSLSILKHQPKNPLLLGIKFRKDRIDTLHSGRYLCAGENKYTEYTRNDSQKGEQMEPLRCPRYTAICSLQAIMNEKGEISGMIAGCCAVKEPHYYDASVFDVAKYSNAIRVNKALSRVSRNYAYSTGQSNIWLCPPNHLVDEFHSELFLPQDTSTCSGKGVTKCEDPMGLTYATFLSCRHISKLGRSKELADLKKFWTRISGVESTVFKRVKTGTQTCAGGFFTGGSFSVHKGTFQKSFTCSSPKGILSTKYTYSDKTVRTGHAIAYSIPVHKDVSVKFTCPQNKERTALCGVATVDIRNYKNSGSSVETSVEGLYYEYLCCPYISHISHIFHIYFTNKFQPETYLRNAT